MFQHKSHFHDPNLNLLFSHLSQNLPGAWAEIHNGSIQFSLSDNKVPETHTETHERETPHIYHNSSMPQALCNLDFWVKDSNKSQFCFRFF